MSSSSLLSESESETEIYGAYEGGEIELLRDLVSNYSHFQVTPITTCKLVSLKEGAFQGFIGMVQEVSKNKVFLELPKLGFKLEAWIDQID